MTQSELQYEKFNALFIWEYRVDDAGADIYYTERNKISNSGKISSWGLESCFEKVFEFLGI